MKDFVNLADASWIGDAPRPQHDIQRLDPDFFSKEAARQEREARRQILLAGQAEADQLLAAALAEAKRNRPAQYLCCPLLTRRWQIFFVDRALDVCDEQRRRPQFYTVFDQEDAVAPGRLKAIDWRRLHAKLRARLGRTLGPHVVAFGMGEVEFDGTRGVWQPHYHLVIFGAPRVRFDWLRKKHYPAKRKGPRPMVRSKVKSLPRWLAYMSKLTVFAKHVVPGQAPAARGRLSPKRSRQYFRYLARSAPTEFVFCMNCRIVKRRSDTL